MMMTISVNSNYGDDNDGGGDVNFYLNVPREREGGSEREREKKERKENKTVFMFVCEIE